MKKKVLVTGANGFIGSHLIRNLKDSNIEALAFPFEVGSADDLQEAYATLDFDAEHIVHLAAKTFVPDSWNQPTVFYRSNVMGTQQVLELCRRFNIGMTYVSSYIYGIPYSLPVSEDAAVASNNPYSHSKFLAEQLCSFYSREFGIPITVLRPFNVFGGGQSEKFLIPHIIKQALKQPTIRVKSLLPRRDYIYIDDLIDAIQLTVTNRKPAFALYNVGSGKSYSVEEVIRFVQGIAGTNKPVFSDNVNRVNEIDDVFADISRISEALHWFPKQTFVEGLTRTIKFEKGV